MKQRKRRVGRTAEWAENNNLTPGYFLKRLNETFPTTIYLTGEMRYFIELQRLMRGKSMTQYITELIKEKMPQSKEDEK